VSSVNELKIAAMRTVASVSSGSMNEVERAYLIFLGATAGNTLNESWLEVFLDNGATSTNWNEAAMQFLAGQGYTNASLNGRWFDWWTAGGA